MRINLQEILQDRFPWLVAEWNGIEWEAEKVIVRRRLNAIESHLRNLEDRYADMENRLNGHTQGTRHRRPRNVLPEPDKEP